ncbi:MAG: endonuclease NucS [Thermoprotei archaeon]|nr:MAG: endonuclease NucS [Thermoprotei archaeon]RLF23975.1 MAG: endonuclease NucS [Thermoprotei archaeon]
MSTAGEDYVLLEEPSLTQVANFINAFKKTRVLVLYLNCEVLYKGRASSKLSPGDRLLITKPDGSLLIHEKTKREPVNWQPPGCILHAQVKGNMLVIRSIRLRPREEILVLSPHVHVLLAAPCTQGEFRLWGSEGEMIELVMKNPSLIEPGLKPLKREHLTPHGKIDLLCEDSKGNIVVLEFKRSTAQLSGVSQLKRYVDYMKKVYGDKCRGILVAPNITSSAKSLLAEYGLEYRRLSPPSRTGILKRTTP